MSWLRATLARVSGLLGRNRPAREFDEELESHLQLHTDDNIRAGMPPGEARRAAILKLGGIEPTREAYRDRSTVPPLANLVRDVRFALRQLARSPGSTCTSLLILALGMAAAIGIFGVVDAALIRPIPYPQPRELVHVTGRIPMLERAALSYLDYLDWRSNTVFGAFDVYTGTGYLLRTAAGTAPVTGARVSAGFFRTLGVAPVLGRDFHDGEDAAGAPDVVILSYGAWQARFGGSPSVVGRTITLDGEPHTIVGVLPRDFQFAPQGRAEVWAPIDPSGRCQAKRSCHNLEGIARLRAGVSLNAAQAEMATIAARLERQYPDSNRGQGATVTPLSEIIVGDIRPVLLVLLGGAALLLAISCVNVATLLLVRAEARKREVAVRSALGATRSRLACQFAAEGLLLAAAGGAIGFVVGSWTMELLTRLVPAHLQPGMPYLAFAEPNIRVCGAALLVVSIAGLVFTVVPLVHVSRPPGNSLADGSRGSVGRTWQRVGARLVVFELATAVVLLSGAGLLGKSLYTLLQVELGFRPERLATVEIAAPASTSGAPERAVAFARQVASRLGSLPGVSSVGLASMIPVRFNGNTDWIRIAGRPYDGTHIEANQRDVSADYFATIGATLLEGRYFGDEEDASTPGVAIVNQTLARRYFPGESPVGQHIGDTSLSPASMKEIIGVVSDIREGALDAEIWPAVYYPFNQSPNTYFAAIVRTSGSERAVLPALHEAIRRLDPEAAAIGGASMQDHILDSPAAYLRRSSTWLVGGFAAVALLLGTVGLHGVVAYAVSQRTREIGVRIALGAPPRAVSRLVVREAGTLAALGIATGLSLSVGAAALARDLLFATSPWDVPTLAAVAALLGASALSASLIPARRAAAVDPVEALRAE